MKKFPDWKTPNYNQKVKTNQFHPGIGLNQLKHFETSLYHQQIQTTSAKNRLISFTRAS